MTNQEINERVALAFGWVRSFLPGEEDAWNKPNSLFWGILPKFSESHDACREIIDHIDKHRPAMSVAFLNALRDVLAPRMPKNKAGSPIITDFDILRATPREICEAFLKAVEKGKK